jgi:hypothetical protein
MSYKRVMRLSGYHKMMYVDDGIMCKVGMCANCGKTIRLNLNVNDHVYETPEIRDFLTDVCPKTNMGGWKRSDLINAKTLTM